MAATGRVPPHSLDAEESLLGAMMLSPGAITAAIDDARLEPTDFYKPAHGAIYAAIGAIHQRGDPVDITIIAEELRRLSYLEEIGGRSTLSQIHAATPASANAKQYALIVADCSMRRHLIEQASSIQELAYTSGDSPHEILERSLAALFEVSERHPEANGQAPTFLDSAIGWHTLFADDDDSDDQWLVEPLLAEGRAHALYAPAKEGKSLLALYVAAGVASGRAVLKRPASKPVPVVYVDYEMSKADVRDRLEAFGYFDADELDHLHYILMPDVAALDSPQGGQILAADVAAVDARLVVIDTTGRAVAGPENESDTYLAFARHTGRQLKRAGVTWMRLDHAGKDVRKGQRGTSAKNDDVDVVWKLAGAEDAFDLVATHRRVEWVPQAVHIVKSTEGPILDLRVLDTGWPSGTVPAAELLARLDVPINATVRNARKMLRAADETCGNATLAAALRWRRERYNNPSLFDDETKT